MDTTAEKSTSGLPDVATIGVSAPFGWLAGAWKDMWSAGHGVSGIHSVISVHSLIEQLEGEYNKAATTPFFNHTAEHQTAHAGS